jgi:hypothetical protein
MAHWLLLVTHLNDAQPHLLVFDPLSASPCPYRPCHCAAIQPTGLKGEQWESREDVLELLSSSPLSSAWDPDVLKTFVQHALTLDFRGGVKLKCPLVQEGLVYTDCRVPYEVRELSTWKRELS